jgi:hypothetical protein
MANLIKIKRTTGNSPPSTNSSEFGLLSYSDGNEILYVTKSDGSITELGGQGKFFKLDESSNVILKDFLIGTAGTSSGNSRAMQFKSEGSTNAYDISLFTSGTDLVIYDAQNNTNQLIVRSDDGTGTYGVDSKYGYSLSGTIVIDKKDGTGKISLLNVDTISNTDSIGVSSAGDISVVSTKTAGLVTIDAASGSVLVDGGSNVAGAVQIIASGTSGNATLKLDSKGTSASAIDINSLGGIDVDAAGLINLTSVNNGSAITIIENGGTSGTVLIQSSKGTSSDSVKVNSVAGGVTVSSTGNQADAVYLHTNGGVSDTLRIHADQGTGVNSGSASVQLTSDDGGINLYSTGNLADAIKLHANGGVSESITILSDQGTSDSSIKLQSDAGGIKVLSTRNAANAINLQANGGVNDTIVVDNTKGTGAGAIELKAVVGGISINTSSASKNITINSAGAIDMDAVAVTMDATDISISSTNALNFGNTDLSFTPTGSGSTSVKTTAGKLEIEGFDGVQIKKAGSTKLEVNGNGDTIVHATGGSITDPNLDVKGVARLRAQTTIGNLQFDGNNTLSVVTGTHININAASGGSVKINNVDIADGVISSTVIDNSTFTDSNLVYSTGDLSVPVSAHTATSSGTGNKTWTYGGPHGLSVGMAVKVGTETTLVDTVDSATVVTVADAIPAPFSGQNTFKDPELFKASNGNGITKLSLDNLGNLDVAGNTVIGGNLTVNGDTTTVNSNVVTIDDATFRLGGDTTPTIATTNDLGIVFPYFDTQARMGFMGWDDSRESFTFASDHTEGAMISGVVTASISAKEIKLGDSDTTMINRSEQWQKVYEELWVNPIGEASATGEREVPTELAAANVDQILMVKETGVGTGVYQYEMTNIIDGGTY